MLLALIAAQLVVSPGPSPVAALRVERGAGTERCPDATELRAEVRARLGYDAFDEGLATEVLVRFTTEGHGLRGELTLRSAGGASRGRRALTSRARDCRELRSALALAASVAVEQLQLVAPEPQPSPPPVPSRAMPTAPVPEAAPAPGPSAAPSPAPVTAPRNSLPSAPVRASLAFGGHGSLGNHPVLAFGFDAGVGLRWRRLGLAAEARVQPSARVDGASGAYAVTDWFGGVVTACVNLPWSELCALVQAGILRADGRNVDRPRAVSAWTAAAGLRASLVVSVLAGLELRAFVELAAPFTTLHLTLAGAALWESPRLSGAVGLRVVALIP